MTYDNLIEQVYNAYYDCRKNKGRKSSAINFSWDYEKNLKELTEELVSGKYQPSTSIVFGITRSKIREIFAANFRDRIVHHLLILKFGELLDKEMVDDSYNCRKGKGLFYGQNRLEEEIKRISENYTKECYILNGDIEGFFMSIDKKKLQQMVERLIRDKYNGNDIEWWIRLFTQIIMHRPELDCEIHGDIKILEKLPSNKKLLGSDGKFGLPIGNLTSQILGNFYRTPFDLMMKRELKEDGFYCVFVDDFKVVSLNKKLLEKMAVKARNYLKQYLGLTMHRKKFSIQKVSLGVKFIGTVIKPWGRYTENRIVNNAFRAFSYKTENVSKQICRYNSYMGYLIHSKSYGIRWNLYKAIPKEIRNQLVCINMKKFNFRTNLDKLYLQENNYK